MHQAEYGDTCWTLSDGISTLGSKFKIEAINRKYNIYEITEYLNKRNYTLTPKEFVDVINGSPQKKYILKVEMSLIDLKCKQMMDLTGILK